MEVAFRNASLELMYRRGRETGKPVYGKEVIRSFLRKIEILRAVANPAELMAFKSLHVEPLVKEERFKGMHSIRVNDQYRIVLKIVKQKRGHDTVDVTEIHDLTDYH